MFLVFVIDLIGLLDICLSFVTGYLDRDSLEIILESNLIVKKYLKTRFIFDLLASFPAEFVLHIPEPQSEEDSFLFTPFIFFIFCKIFHLCTLLSYLHGSKELKSSLTYLSKLIFRILFIVIVIHWLTCLLLMMTRFRYGDNVDNIPRSNWIYQISFDQMDTTTRYILSSYVVMRTILGFQHDDKVKIFFLDHCAFCMAMALFGYCLKIAITMQFIILIRSKNASHLRYQNILQQFEDFLMYKQMAFGTSKRLMDYYEYRFQKYFYKEGTVLDSLSSHLQHEILVTNCKRLVENVPFFTNFPPNLIMNIVKLLDAEIYLPKVIIDKCSRLLLKLFVQPIYLLPLFIFRILLLKQENLETACTS